MEISAGLSLTGMGPKGQVLLLKPAKSSSGECSCVYSLAWFWMVKLLTCVGAKQSVWASGPRGAGLHGKVGHLDTYLRTGERQSGLLKRRTVLPSLTSGPRTISAASLGVNGWAFMGLCLPPLLTTRPLAPLNTKELTVVACLVAW